METEPTPNLELDKILGSNTRQQLIELKETCELSMEVLGRAKDEFSQFVVIINQKLLEAVNKELKLRDPENWS